MDVLKLAEAFQKLAQNSPGVYVAPEITIEGDPSSKEDQEADAGKLSPKEVFRKAGWNWDPHIYYTPTQEKDRQILIQNGFQYINGVGLVPPEDVEFVTKALANGWKYAGAGFGLVPAEWYDFLKREKYI